MARNRDTLPPVIGGEGSATMNPWSERKKDVLPPVVNGSGGVGSPPEQRALELPPTVG